MHARLLVSKPCKTVDVLELLICERRWPPSPWCCGRRGVAREVEQARQRVLGRPRWQPLHHSSIDTGAGKTSYRINPCRLTDHYHRHLDQRHLAFSRGQTLEKPS
jgi:hypothetical protein